MSDRDYIAWSLLVAGALALVGGALFWISRRAPVNDWNHRLSEARGEKLQRRLEKRLARGSDNYFEEMRSIKAAIERHDSGMSGGLPPRVRFRTAYGVLMAFAALIFGLFLTKWFGPDLFGGGAPKWAYDLFPAFMLIMGMQYMLDSGQPGSTWAWGQRALGGGFLLIGLLSLWSVIARLAGAA